MSTSSSKIKTAKKRKTQDVDFRARARVKIWVIFEVRTYNKFFDNYITSLASSTSSI